MKSLKDKIQFHPQRPSRSKSRTKFSPYHMAHPNEKQISQARQNREKITMKQPIIKIRELISGTSQKNKLTLNSEKAFYEPNLLSATNFSNCNFHSPFQTIENSKFNDLAAKIDQQSEVIEQYFSQLNKKLKLPKLQSEKQQTNEKQTQKQKQTQTQHLILEQLKELKNISNQNIHLRQIIARYEREFHFYRSQMEKLQYETAALRQTIAALENTIRMLEEQKKQNKNSYNQLESKESKTSIKASKESGTKQDQKEVRFLESQKRIKSQLILIETLKKEIESLKLQNEMLSQQVKLLNYSLNQREKEFQKLMRNKTINKEASQKKSQSKRSSIVQQIAITQSRAVNQDQQKQSQSIKQPFSENQGEDIQISVLRHNKKTKSFIIQSSDLKQRPFNNLRRSQLYSTRKRCSIDQQILSENILKALSVFQSPALKKSASFQSKNKFNHEKINAQIDKRKLNYAKSILKIGTKLNPTDQKKNKKERKDFDNFSNSKLVDLQIIRKTIGARWRVLRIQFSDIQKELIQKHHSRINQKEMTQYLEVYPFFLNMELIQEILRYILRKEYEEQEEAEEWPSVEIDIFCNHLREFIPESSPLQEQQQLVMMQKIKGVLFQKNKSLMQELGFQQTQEGIIREAQMRTVLQQFKFSQPQIQLMIGQCCLISLDIQHLSFDKYFSFFNQHGSPRF